MRVVSVPISELEKVRDVLEQELRFHKSRDEMNAALHLGQTRYSPLTSEVEATRDRVIRWFALEASVREVGALER